MTRRELVYAVIRKSVERAEAAAHRFHFWVIVAGGAMLVAFGIYLEHYWLAVVLPFLALVALFVWGLFEQAFQLCLKKEKEAEEACRARDEAIARLKPNLEILDGAEIDPIQQRCRIRVRSLCDVNLRFGSELKGIQPHVEGVPLPFTLRITQEANDLTGTLPARQTRTVDVVMNGENVHELWFLGIGDSRAVVQKNPYRIIICAHCNEGPSVEKEFIVDLEKAIPGLRRWEA